MSLIFSLPLVMAVILVGCSTGTEPSDGAATEIPNPAASESAPTVDPLETPSDRRYPDVLAAELTTESGGTYTIAVTISSPYDSPDQYADGWRVLSPKGVELGSHTLGHDHESEQPFTRTQYALVVPRDVTEVTVEGRDTQNGYGGETVTVQVPPPAE